MAQRARKPCAAPGCAELVQSGAYCTTHQPAIKREDDRPTAHERGYGATWRVIRLAHLRREPVCRDPYHKHPEQLIPATDVDHIVPRSAGGTDEDSNLQSLCHECHSYKTAVQSSGWKEKSGEWGHKSLAG